MTTTLTSRQFHQDSGSVKKAVAQGPVIITDRGKPSLVLLTYEAYEQLQPRKRSLADALYMPGADEVELELSAQVPYVACDIDWE